MPDSERILVEATSKVLKFDKYWKDVIRVTKDGLKLSLLNGKKFWSLIDKQCEENEKRDYSHP